VTPPDPSTTDTALSGTPEFLIEAVGVSKKYCRDFRKSLRYSLQDVVKGFTGNQDLTVLRDKEFWAVQNASFQLRRGESLGLIGHNGAGKSTLLKLLNGQRGLTSGTVTTRGRVVALNDLGLGFDPVLTGRENAYINASVFGIPRNQIEPVIDAIIDFAGIREFIDSAVQTYSSGMKARLGFAIGTHLEPDILMVDEVLAVGDLDFRRKCVSHVQDFLSKGGSLVLVAHDPYLIQTVCSRVLVMEKGQIIFDGPAVEGVDLHFQLGHSKRLEEASQTTGRTQQAGETGDGQTRERNWLTPAGETGAGKGQRRLPTAEEPVVIDNLDITATDATDLQTGCEALVTLRCHSLNATDVGWGFTLWTVDMLTCIASFTLGLDGRRMQLRQGENIFRCRIPKLPLRPGSYALRGGIMDSRTLLAMALLGYEDKPTYFTIKGQDSDYTSNLRSLLGDLVEIDADWIT